MVPLRRAVPIDAQEQSLAEASGGRQRRARHAPGRVAHRTVPLSPVRGRSQCRGRWTQRHALLRHHGGAKAQLLEAVRRSTPGDQGHQQGAARSQQVRLLPDRRRHERVPAVLHARPPGAAGRSRTRVRPGRHVAAFPHHVDPGEQGRLFRQVHRVRPGMGAGRTDDRAAQQGASRPGALRLLVRLEHRASGQLPAEPAPGLRCHPSHPDASRAGAGEHRVHHAGHERGERRHAGDPHQPPAGVADPARRGGRSHCRLRSTSRPRAARWC